MSDASRHSQGCLAAVSSYRINEVNRSNYVGFSACSLRQGNRCHVLSTIHASLLAFSARIEPFRTPPASCCLDLEGSDLHDNASFFVTSHQLVRLYVQPLRAPALAFLTPPESRQKPMAFPQESWDIQDKARPFTQATKICLCKGAP